MTGGQVSFDMDALSQSESDQQKRPKLEFKLNYLLFTLQMKS